MNCYSNEERIPTFATVGALRNLLKDYPDDTPITICGIPGLFYGNKENNSVLLETMDSSGYEIMDEEELEEADF